MSDSLKKLLKTVVSAVVVFVASFLGEKFGIDGISTVATVGAVGSAVMLS